MAIINRTSKEIVALTRFRLKAYVNVEHKRFYFPMIAEKLCEFKLGEFVHFINDGSEWSFYINDDPDGFELTPISKTRPGALICSIALVRLFRNSTGFLQVTGFEIEKTNNFHDKCRVFKINTAQPTTMRKQRRKTTARKT